MLEKLATVRLGVDLKRISWRVRGGQAAAAGKAIQSPIMRAALLGGLGYAWLLAFPFLAYWIAAYGDLPHRITVAGTSAEFGAIAAWIVIAALAVLMTYALVRFRPALPDEQVLRREQAPALFQLLDELRREYPGALLRRPVTIQRVCITAADCMELIRTPRLGFPFAFTNTLTIGLPVLQTLSAQQFRVALARKLGQLSGRDNGVAGWLYHLRGIWPCYTRLHGLKPAPCRWLLQAFFLWYVPLYHRNSAEVARAFEHAGDEYALQVVDPDSVAEALVAMAVSERFLKEKFWPAIHSMCGKLPEPQHLPYAHLERSFRKGVQQSDRQSWLSQALAAPAAPHSAVPSLQERIQDLGWAEGQIPEWNDNSAAQDYLGQSLDTIVQAMDQAWLRQNQPVWRKRFKKHQKSKARLAALQQKLDSAQLSDDELRELVKRIDAHRSGRDAANLYQRVLSQKPDDAKLHFAIGSRLLRLTDASGVTALERAMALEEQYAEPACRLISQFRKRAEPVEAPAAH